MNAKLSERAMLASLNVRRWYATLTDKKITEQVAAEHNVKASRAGRYRKFAIDIETPSFKAVRSAASALRDKHYHHTLPWGQDGARILTAQNFERYSDDMRKLRADFEACVAVFVGEYPDLVKAAETELNGLFNAADYPTNIKSKFGVDVVIMPLPEAGDFRAQLADSDVAQIKVSIEEELAKTTAAAMREPYERLFKRVASIASQCQPNAPVHASTIEALRDLCEFLPALNLTGDEHLESLRVQAQELIRGVDAKTLRDVPEVRAAVGRRANEIQDAMAAFMGAAPALEERDNA